MALALELVQMISLRALMPALQLIYEITMWSGCCSRNFLNKGGGQLSLSEHPAFRSGITTFLEGLRIFAPSAMKCTPANTIMSASVLEACWARPKESPI